MIYILSILLIFLDQITKYIAKTILITKDTVPFINNFLHFTYVENTGAAFGMLQNQRFFFIGLTIVAVAIILIQYIRNLKKHKDKVLEISIALIIAGAIGNLIDRLFLGYVVDFIDIRLFSFPVFNIADICITFGVAIYFIKTLRYDNHEQN